MMKKLTVKTTAKSVKTTKNAKDFYAFGNYKPNKNAKPVVYNGTTYLSKAQCMALEGITRKDLDAYLNGQEETVVEAETQTPEQVAIEENLDEQAEELIQDILAEQGANSLDALLNE